MNPGNQPTLSDPHAAMGLYADLNHRLAALCPEPARSCIQSYAAYQACNSSGPAADCGAPPSCSAGCPLSPESFQSLKVTFCSDKISDSYSLTPDWSSVARKMQAEMAASREANPTPLKIIKAPPGPPTDFMGKPLQPGCTVEESYATAMMLASMPSLMSLALPAAVPDNSPHLLPNGHYKVAPSTMQSFLQTKVEPVYPPVAKAAHVSGVVRLNVVVSNEGKVTEAAAVDGPDLLRESALIAVRQWTYKPFLVADKPQTVETTLLLNFTFSGN